MKKIIMKYLLNSGIKSLELASWKMLHQSDFKKEFLNQSKINS